MALREGDLKPKWVEELQRYMHAGLKMEIMNDESEKKHWKL